ncbi:MAG: hypothetical protein HOO88_05570 [Kiritimatiellaceae bacterium]|nr:hypothetical protein [Kiritimatiellaceae bacterium]
MKTVFRVNRRLSLLCIIMLSGVFLLESRAFAEPSSPWASVSFAEGKPTLSGAEWVVRVNQQDGAFPAAPARWSVDSEKPWGRGKLVLELDRTKLTSDLAMSFVCASSNANFIIQLLNDKDQIVALDLFSNVADVMGAINVSTLVIPLMDYPSASKICIRRLSGPLAVHSLILIPAAIGIDAPQSAGVLEMAKRLGDPLSSSNELVRSLQQACDPAKPVQIDQVIEKPHVSYFETASKLSPDKIIEFINGISVDGSDFTADCFVRFAEKGELEMLNLFYQAGMPLTVHDQRGMTAGQGAGFTGQIRVLDWLLANGFPIEEPDTIGRTALFAAVQNEKYDALSYLLMRGAKAEVNSRVLRTPLFYAVCWGDTSHSDNIREALIAAGAQVNFQDEKGVSVLMNAVRSGHLRQVRGLISHGADVNATDRAGLSVMEYAVQRGNRPIIAALQNAGAAQASVLANPLHQAVKARDYALCQELLIGGADPNDKDMDGRTALGWAAHNASGLQIMVLLLQYGADVNSADSKGRTPLLDAAIWNWGKTDSILPLLLEAGADPNHQDQAGVTALHVAVGGDATENIRVLLEHGANPQICDKRGRYPKDLARDKGAELNQMILKYHQAGAAQ